jgi:hypothetical protein
MKKEYFFPFNIQIWTFFSLFSMELGHVSTFNWLTIGQLSTFSLKTIYIYIKKLIIDIYIYPHTLESTTHMPFELIHSFYTQAAIL